MVAMGNFECWNWEEKIFLSKFYFSSKEGLSKFSFGKGKFQWEYYGFIPWRNSKN
jgi:hypothetical protein